MRHHSISLRVVCLIIFLSVTVYFCICCFSKGEVDRNGLQYEIDFYSALVQNMNASNQIFLRDLVPKKWDTVKVFKAYATENDKIDYVGYRYADSLEDITHEDVMSLLFLEGHSVVYYVDVLVPRMFKTKMISPETMEISLNNEHSIVLEFLSIPVFHDWVFEATFEESSFEENPFFEVYWDNKKPIITLRKQ